jgi:tRNA/rRNA methyltransferase
MTTSVIFVEPENSGNVGFLARAMANFGLSRLILVNPKCEIDMMARARAMHAWDIAKKAKIEKSYDRVLSKFDFVIGTTAQVTPHGNNTTRAYMTPRELADAMRGIEGKVAIVIGRESSGLTTGELRKCDITVHIPATEKYPTLNATHAAAIIFYELFSEKANPYRKASRREKDLLVQYFGEIAYDPALNLRNPENAVKMFNNVISRAFVSGREAHGIAGVLGKLKGLKGEH